MPLQTRLRTLRSPAVTMAAGMLVFAGAGYAFVALAGRALPKDQATLATSLYFLANVVGPGIFFAVEQVTSRSTSAAVVAGAPLGPVARRSYAAGLRLLAVVTVVLGALAPVLGSRTLHGTWSLYAEVVATPAIALNLHLVRGMLAGRQRFGGYSATLAAEGLMRLALCAVVVGAGVTRAWVLGLAYIGATAFAALVGFAVLRRGGDDAGPVPAAAAAPAPAAGADKGLAALALATLLSQLLPNIAPLAVNSRLDAASPVALTFSQAAVVARIPLLMFLPIQAMILPRLSTAAARGDLLGVRSVVRKILLLTVGAGVAGSAVFVLAGPWVLRTFFGATTDLPFATLLGLALSTVILMAAYGAQPALVALGRDGMVMTGWGSGSLVTVVVAVLPIGAVAAATWGQVLGPSMTAVLFAFVALVRPRAGARLAPSAASGGGSGSGGRPMTAAGTRVPRDSPSE